MGPGERFFDYQRVLDKYSERVLKAFSIVHAARPEIVSISLFGELFGGAYPLPDVPKNPKVQMPVQKGVWYSPDIDFYAFDIKMHPNAGYMLFDKASAIFAECGFFHAQPIIRGAFEEVMAFDVEPFETTIPTLLGLPKIEKNFAEGIVLKPTTGGHTRVFSRVILKKKHSSFVEKSVWVPLEERMKRPPKEKEVLPERVNVVRLLIRVRALLHLLTSYSSCVRRL